MADYIYAGDGSKVRKIDLSTGNEVTTGNWPFETGDNRVYSLEADSDGNIYVGTGYSYYYVVMLDSDGVEQWRISPAGNVKDIFVGDGYIWIALYNNGCEKLDISDGGTLNSLPNIDESIIEDELYVYGGRYDTWAFKSNNDQLWKNVSYGAYSIDFAPDGNIICGGSQDKVAKLDKADGSFIWENTEHTSSVNYILVYDSYIYSASDDNTIKKIPADGSSSVWTYDFGTTVRWLVIKNGYLYACGEESNTIDKIDIETGNEVTDIFPFYANDVWSLAVSQAPTTTFSNPSPTDGATNISTNPMLSIDVTHAEDSADVEFYDASDDTLIGTDTVVSSGGTASITWSDLSSNTEYSWYAKINSTQSSTYSFTTTPLATFSNPSPDDGSIAVSTSTSISIDITHTYDSPINVAIVDSDSQAPLYLEENVSSGSTVTSDPLSLPEEQTVNWEVWAGSYGETPDKSSTYSFTTGLMPGSDDYPVFPINESPGDNSLANETPITLSLQVYKDQSSNLDITFYEYGTDNVIGTTSVKFAIDDTNEIVSVSWNSCSGGEEYKWYAEINNGQNSTYSPVYTFRTYTATENNFPSYPISVTPSDGAYIQEEDALEVELDDIDGDDLIVDFYHSDGLIGTDTVLGGAGTAHVDIPEDMDIRNQIWWVEISDGSLTTTSPKYHYWLYLWNTNMYLLNQKTLGSRLRVLFPSEAAYWFIDEHTDFSEVKVYTVKSRVLIASDSSIEIWSFVADGLGSKQGEITGFNSIVDIAADRDLNIYVMGLDGSNDRCVWKYTKNETTGEWEQDYKSADSFDGHVIECDGDGNAYCADTYDGFIYKYYSSGNLAWFYSETDEIEEDRLCVDSSGAVYYITGSLKTRKLVEVDGSPSSSWYVNRGGSLLTLQDPDDGPLWFLGDWNTDHWDNFRRISTSDGSYVDTEDIIPIQGDTPNSLAFLEPSQTQYPRFTVPTEFSCTDTYEWGTTQSSTEVVTGFYGLDNNNDTVLYWNGFEIDHIEKETRTLWVEGSGDTEVDLIKVYTQEEHQLSTNDRVIVNGDNNYSNMVGNVREVTGSHSVVLQWVEWNGDGVGKLHICEDLDDFGTPLNPTTLSVHPTTAINQLGEISALSPLNGSTVSPGIIELEIYLEQPDYEWSQIDFYCSMNTCFDDNCYGPQRIKQEPYGRDGVTYTAEIYIPITGQPFSWYATATDSSGTVSTGTQTFTTTAAEDLRILFYRG